MRRFREKFTVLFLGIVLSIFLLEIALRIIGCIHLKTATSDKVVQKEENSYVILCVGDSFTEGLGAPQGKDYPSQLEDLLNSIDRQKVFAVINQGKAGHNTAQILDELPDNIDRIKPALIVLLAGGADNWNYWGYQEYLKGKTLFSVLHVHLYRVRIYKLIKLLCFNIKSKTKNNLSASTLEDIRLYENQDRNEEIIKRPEGNMKLDLDNNRNYTVFGWACEEKGRYKEASRWFKKGIKLDPDDSENYAGLGWVNLHQRKYEEASRWFKKGIKLTPDDSRNYSALGWVCEGQGKYEEASRWFKKGIKLDPDDSENYAGLGWVYLHNREIEKAIKCFQEGIKIDPDNNQNYQGIGRAYLILRKHGKHKDYFEIINFLRDLETNNPFVLNYIEMFEEKTIDKKIANWIKFEIGKIIQMCQEGKIKVIVQNYPGDNPINRVIKEVVKEYSIPFIDNEYTFDKFWSKGIKEKVYFISDGHCNAKGYGVMAKNIYEKIIEQKIVEIE